MAAPVKIPVRKLLIECSPAIFTQFNVPNYYKVISTSVPPITYLRLFLTAEEYTRIVEGEKTNLVDTYSIPYVHPKVVRVGFSARITEDDWRIRAALEYLATSSISTGYSTYIPVMVIDYVRPEVTNYSTTGDSFTVRKGIMTISEDSGTAGVDNAQYSNAGFTINFKEIGKRLIM